MRLEDVFGPPEGAVARRLVLFNEAKMLGGRFGAVYCKGGEGNGWGKGKGKGKGKERAV